MGNDDYTVVSVEPAVPPGGAAGTGWHCYIIEQGNNTIRGYKRGHISAVTTALEEIVARLNERRIGSRGRIHLTMSAQTKKGKSR